MATTTPDTGELRLVLDDILVGDNVRDVDQEHVENLAQSIALRGAAPRSPTDPLIRSKSTLAVRSVRAGLALHASHRARGRRIARP